MNEKYQYEFGLNSIKKLYESRYKSIATSEDYNTMLQRSILADELSYCVFILDNDWNAHTQRQLATSQARLSWLDNHPLNS